MSIPPVIIAIFVGGWVIAILMFIIVGGANKKKIKAQIEASQYKGDKTLVAQVYNYIYIDSINGKPMDTYPVELAMKRKGALASQIEIVYLEPGTYGITAYGATYQTTPVTVNATVEAGKYYCLGANEAGVYLEERPYEWTMK